MTARINQDDPPDWLRPAAVAILLGTLALIAVMLILILAGIADPHPIGALTVDASSVATLDASSGHRLYQDSGYEVHCPCTIEMTARRIEGSAEARYGFGWQADTGDPTIIGINDDSYYAAFEGERFIVDWQRFPWIVAGKANRLRADIDAASVVTYRISDEVAANFEWSGGQDIRIGFYVEITEGEATIQVERLRIWLAK